MEKHKGLAAKYFIAGPRLPLCPVCSSPGMGRDREHVPALAPRVPQHPAPSTGTQAQSNQEWGSKATWEERGHFQKGFGTALHLCFPDLLVFHGALPTHHSGALVPVLPKPLQGVFLPLQGKTCLAEVAGAWQHPQPSPPNTPVLWRANPRSQNYLEQSWGQMSQIKRKMSVVDKRNDSWKWCFQGSFILGAGKMK